MPEFIIESGNNNIFLINFQMDRAVAALATTHGQRRRARRPRDDRHVRDDRARHAGGHRRGARDQRSKAWATPSTSEALVPVETGGVGPETAAAVTRFKEEGVDGVFLLGNCLPTARS